MKDKVFRGKPISPGYADGRVVVFGTGQTDVPVRSISAEDIDREIGRFYQALDRSRTELLRLSDRVRLELGAAEADIFAAHLLFLQDPQFVSRVEEAVRRDRVNVEAAVTAVVADLAMLLGSVDNEYLREREADVRDLGKRVLRNIGPSSGLRLLGLGAKSICCRRKSCSALS